MKFVLTLLVCVLLLPYFSSAELSDEDLQYIAQSDRDVINQINGNIDARSQQCVQYLEGKTEEARNVLDDYRAAILWRIVLGVYGAVFAAHFCALLVVDKLKKSVHLRGGGRGK